MKEAYETLEIEVISFQMEDVIRTSGLDPWEGELD